MVKERLKDANYDINNKKKVIARADAILKELPSLRHMLVIKEIFGTPAALRNPCDSPWER
jgi:hypothetical protein